MKASKIKKMLYLVDRMYKKDRVRQFRRMPDDMVKRLFWFLEYRQKSHGYKKQNYCDNFYYVTMSGELGCIKNKGHNTGKALGELLVRRGVIDKRTHEAKVEINGDKNTYGIKGVIIKHNRVLDDIKKTLSEKEFDYLSKFFDATETCEMVIDKDFEKAYEPSYRESAVYGGDLCSSSSCMSKRGKGAQEFYGAIPCCNVVRFEKNGEQVGRCIMYDYKGQRHFIRIYGKPEYLPKMYRLLNKELKANDLFGRTQCIPNLIEETKITDETTNMYLDGNSYGFKRQVDENGENPKYIMCSYDSSSEVKGQWSNMKSTSSDPVKRNFKCNGGNGDYQCAHCGCDIFEDDDDVVWIDNGDVYCSYDCAHEDGWYQCNHCGEWGNCDGGDGFWIGDNFYCCNDCAESDGWRYCEGCGEWQGEDDFEHVECWGESYCSDCIEEYLRNGELERCEECSELYEPSDLKTYIDKNNHEEVRLCEGCFDPEYYDETEEKEGEDVDENK